MDPLTLDLIMKTIGSLGVVVCTIGAVVALPWREEDWEPVRRPVEAEPQVRRAPPCARDLTEAGVCTQP